jgi:hypothetical protein
MRTLLKRALIGILAVAVALECVYLLAVNVFLNTDLAPKTINRRPERFEMRWSAGWSLWPGMVSLRDISLRGRSAHRDWYAHLDSVTTGFHLLPLFQHTVHLTSVRATGVDYRQRRRLLPGESSPIPLAELAPIPESLGAPPARPRPPGVAKPHAPPWKVLADAIDCEVGQLWIERFRLTGPLQVSTPMRLVVRGELEFPRVRATMTSGDLRAGDEKIFDGFGLDVEATIHPFLPRNARRLAFFHDLSGRFDLHSRSASLFFLEAYFRKTPWLRFNERANARMEMRLDHGRLQPGSTLEITNDHVDLEVLDRHLTGKGVILGKVGTMDGQAQSTITANLRDFQIAPVGSTETVARGRSATLVASSTAMDLSNPFTDLRVVFDLPEAEILDLKFYNSMIPPGSRFQLLSGSGLLHYHLEGSQEERSLHGNIDLTVKQAAAQFDKYEMRGGFTLNSVLRQASPRELLFDISGTRLSLHTEKSDWSAAFLFPRARMSFSEPMRVDAALQMEMLDTRPLVALFDALKGAPNWLERMMIIENIRGSAALDVRRDAVAITDLDVTGKGLKALADLTLGKDTRNGILYLHFHGFSFGIALRKDDKDVKILRPLHWFEQQRARRRSTPASP